ncbi:hypothetical protein C8R45DRAFT_596557 [Mycena sanguinolenta]|nr:hypothetical protein C8R45DRAFT_596557 [Mycena sanguinolenta]
MCCTRTATSAVADKLFQPDLVTQVTSSIPSKNPFIPKHRFAKLLPSFLHVSLSCIYRTRCVTSAKSSVQRRGTSSTEILANRGSWVNLPRIVSVRAVRLLSPMASSLPVKTVRYQASVVLSVYMWAMAVSILVSFIGVGWWSALGDRRGRKCILLISISRAVPRDLICLAVAQTEFQEHGVAMAPVVDGLLGGFATFTGVTHAYASFEQQQFQRQISFSDTDVSASPIFRTLNFCLLHAVAFVSFRLGAILGYVGEYNPAHSNAVFGGSIFLEFYNGLRYPRPFHSRPNALRQCPT